MAVGKEDEIKKAWTFINQQIAPTLTGLVSKADFIEYALGKFRSLALDEELQTLPPEAQARPVQQNKRIEVNMDGDEFDDRFFFESGDVTIVERDLNDLARENSFFATNQYASLNILNAKTVVPKGMDIPDNEKLFAVFACSLWAAGSLPRPGKLFLTPNYVGFQSSAILLFGSQVISLRFTDIVHLHFFVQSGFECIQMIAKKNPHSSSSSSLNSGGSSSSSSNSGGNINSQSLAGFHTIAFATITGGAQIFDEVNKLWKLSMKKFQEGENDKKRVREGEKKDEYLVTFEEAMKSKQSGTNEKSTETDLLGLAGGSGSSIVGKSVSTSSVQSHSGKKDVVSMAKKALERLSEKVIKRFRLPSTEVLLTQAQASLSVYARRGTSFVKSSNDVANVSGVLYVTPHFICFMDDALFRASPLGAESSERSNKAFSSMNQPGGGAEEVTENLNDEMQTTAVMLAEWDVAAAEDDDDGDLSNTLDAAAKLQMQRQQQQQQIKKSIPATSLATAEDAPSRLWCVIPLREVSRAKIGKPTNQASTAYAEFGMTPHIINIHLPHNMYAFTVINRPHLFDCISKVHARVQRQESLRNPLPNYCAEIPQSSAASQSSTSSSQSSSSQSNANTLPTTPGKGNANPSNNQNASTASSPVSIPSKGNTRGDLSPTVSFSPSSPPVLIGTIGSAGSSSSILSSFSLLGSPSADPHPHPSHLEPPPRSIFFKHVSLHPLSSGDAKFPDTILNDSRQFASTYRARERLQEEKFLNYFHKYGQSSGLARKGPELAILVRNGIPHSLRGHLWFSLSGACANYMNAPKNYYKTLLETHAGKTSTAVEQIERDLHRSMPSHPFYAIKRYTSEKTDASNPKMQSGDSSSFQPTSVEEEYKPCVGNAIYHPLNPPNNEPMGISRLRRVLVAYAWHNPVIAYCQSMNIVVAALLLYMSEEETFYTLITLVEYLEEYWTREMMGAIVDMLVLKDVLKQKRPALVAHLESLELDYSIAALPWFMCLFIGYVPMQLSLRLMDCFFYNAGLGKATSTLFQAAIALFTIAEEQLMQCYDPVAVNKVFREVPYGVDCDKLISLVFSDDSLALRTTIVDELRNFHRYNAIQNIESQNMEEEFMVLVYGRKENLMKNKKEEKKDEISTEKSEIQSIFLKSGDTLTLSNSNLNSSIARGDSSSSNDQNNSNASLSTGMIVRKANPPPSTPVHFALGDLKRLYFNFKDVVMSELDVSSSQQRKQEDATRIANAKSVISSLNEKAFKTLFRQHMSWWPSECDNLLSVIFNWMDVSETTRLSFVEYVQGIDVFCFGNARIISELVYDLSLICLQTSSQKILKPSSQSVQPSTNPIGMDKKLFEKSVRLIYFIMLYSKADPESLLVSDVQNAPAPSSAAPPKPVPRRRLNLDSVNATNDSMDDWLLLNADEVLNGVVDPETLDSIFQSYSENGMMPRERFLIAVLNQINLTPPSTMHDL